MQKNRLPPQEHQIKIILDPDVKTLTANGKDLAFITVSVVDKNGIPCPTASTPLSFKVNGAGNFKAVCNGDPTSLEPFHLPTMQLFSGKLVVIIESTEKAGSIAVKVTGKGLKTGQLELQSKSLNP